MSAQESLLAAATLATGSTIDRWSRVGALAALIALIVTPTSSAITSLALGASLLAGLAQACFAARTTLDGRIFAAWGRRWQDDAGAIDSDLAAFDAALVAHFDRQMPARKLEARIQSALGLLRRQTLAFGLQLTLLIIALILHHPGFRP